MREIYGFLRLASPFGLHLSQVRTQICKLALTCVDLRVRLAGALNMKIFSRVFNSFLFVNY